MLLDANQRVIDDLDAAPEAGKAKGAWPNLFAPANADRQNRHAGVQSHPNGARFELSHRAIWKTAPALGKNHDRSAFTHPLHGAPNGCGIASFKLQRPGAE